MNNKSNKVYIYNWEQALYYMNRGLKPLDTPKQHCTTKRIFFVFDYNEVQPVFSEWVKIKNR